MSQRISYFGETSDWGVFKPTNFYFTNPSCSPVSTQSAVGKIKWTFCTLWSFGTLQWQGAVTPCWLWSSPSHLFCFYSCCSVCLWLVSSTVWRQLLLWSRLQLRGFQCLFCLFSSECNVSLWCMQFWWNWTKIIKSGDRKWKLFQAEKPKPGFLNFASFRSHAVQTNMFGVCLICI